MRQAERRRLVALAAALAALGAAACSVPADDSGSLADLVPAAVADQGAVVVAADLGFPPAGFVSPTEFEGVAGGAVESGEFTGFEVELVEAAADLLGLRVEWFDVPFADVLQVVQTERADLAASAVTVTPERTVNLDFVTVFRTGTQWVTVTGNPRGVTPGNACGARVAVQTATVQVDDVASRSSACEQQGRDPIAVREYDDPADLASALLEGTVDAMATDLPAAEWAVRQAGGASGAASTTTFRELDVAGAPYDEQPYGWAFRPEDAPLAQAFVTAVQQLVENGTYAEILDFWSVSDGALPAQDVELLD